LEAEEKIEETPVIALSDADYDLWDDAQLAFGRCRRITISKLLLCVRMDQVRRLVNLGLIEMRKTQVFRTRLTVVLKNRPLLLEYQEEKVDRFDDTEPEESPKVVRVVSPPRRPPAEELLMLRVMLLTEDQLQLLRYCMKRTNWERGRYSCRINARLVYELGNYTSEDISSLMEALGLNSAKPNYFLPKYMKGKTV